jgi:hypothetical protein
MGEVLLFLGRLFSLSYGVQDVDGVLTRSAGEQDSCVAFLC